MLRTLIIDDEILAREELRRLLAVHANVNVVGEAGRLADARAALEAGGYDLVLLDIQLKGGTGFDLVPAVPPSARIIFVTAHDRFAVRAFEVNALDYLLKPVRAERLAEALGRLDGIRRLDAQFAGQKSSEAAAPAVLGRDDLVYLKTDIDTARFVRVADISAVLSHENYTQVHLTDGGRLLVRRTLTSWETTLPSADFLRVHRTAFVNLHAVTALAPFDRHVLLLTVRGAADPVRARRELMAEIERRLAALKK